MAEVWIIALALMAALSGWAQGTYLRRANPTRRISVLRWRIKPGDGDGPRWAFVVSAVVAVVSVPAMVHIASDNVMLGAALVVGWLAIALLVQAVVLGRHNEQLRQRS